MRERQRALRAVSSKMGMSIEQATGVQGLDAEYLQKHISLIRAIKFREDHTLPTS